MTNPENKFEVELTVTRGDTAFSRTIEMTPNYSSRVLSSSDLAYDVLESVSTVMDAQEFDRWTEGDPAFAERSKLEEQEGLVEDLRETISDMRTLLDDSRPYYRKDGLMWVVSNGSIGFAVFSAIKALVSLF